MKSIIIIDQNLLGICLGPDCDLGEEAEACQIIVILIQLHGFIDPTQAMISEALSMCYRRLSIAQNY